jgi:hypothetical protein
MYCHLVIYDNLVFFPSFWYSVNKKSGNPVCGELFFGSNVSQNFFFRKSYFRAQKIGPEEIKVVPTFSNDHNFFCVDNQGCQMVFFQTKNTNLGTFWRVLQWKMFEYFMSIRYILRPFGIFSGFWYIFSRKIWQPC